ncbi:hypothetical protein SPONN_746 [uncultured Candidatus Thioglobus sp.]|nr:hypothetical protein SPONN_746 [uncultured Candidatus Thioglobus sp.]
MNAINQLPDGDVSNLTNVDGYRLRVGGLRVLFDMDDSNIIIRSINPRGQAYK